MSAIPTERKAQFLHERFGILAQAPDGLRAFLAVLGNDDVGLFVSTGGFTRDTGQEARTQENRKITLVSRLFDRWVEHCHKLSDTARQRLPLRPLHFLTWDN